MTCSNVGPRTGRVGSGTLEGSQPFYPFRRSGLECTDTLNSSGGKKPATSSGCCRSLFKRVCHLLTAPFRLLLRWVKRCFCPEIARPSSPDRYSSEQGIHEEVFRVFASFNSDSPQHPFKPMGTSSNAEQTQRRAQPEPSKQCPQLIVDQLLDKLIELQDVEKLIRGNKPLLNAFIDAIFQLFKIDHLQEGRFLFPERFSGYLREIRALHDYRNNPIVELNSPAHLFNALLIILFKGAEDAMIPRELRKKIARIRKV